MFTRTSAGPGKVSWARKGELSYYIWPFIVKASCTMSTLPCGKLQGKSNTIELKCFPTSQVSPHRLIAYTYTDEFKWGIRQPSRFAISELTLNYLDQVQNEVSNYLRDNIKHDFMKPDRELSLHLTVKEAEILATANPDVRALAEKGDLKLIHERCRSI